MNLNVRVVDDLSAGSMVNVPVHTTCLIHDIANGLPPDYPGVDVVFHLAAVSRIGTCRRDPFRAYQTNVSGTARMLDYARRCGARFVFASSCTAAEPALSDYGGTKASGEEMVSHRGGVSARLFNVYGPGEPAIGPTSTITARALHAARTGRTLEVNGDGAQTRDFVHVDDVVSALIVLARDPDPDDEPYDVGTGETTSILDLVQQVGCRYTLVPAAQGEMSDARADPRRMGALGWSPKRRLSEYIQSVRG